jgi:hypothetical protein
MGDDIDGAMQQAPHPLRHWKFFIYHLVSNVIILKDLRTKVPHCDIWENISIKK